MRRALVVILALLLVAACAWAQTVTTDPLLGPHNVGSVGCQSCHAPHNALAGPGAYLWARAIPTRTYTTYTTSTGAGGTLSAMPSSGNGMVSTGGFVIGSTSTTNPGALSTLNNLPQAHTILCLSCHDTTFSAMGCTTSPTGCTTGIYTGTPGATWNGNPNGTLPGTNYAIGNNGNLTQDHPVDVAYPTADPTYFGISIASATDGTGQYTVSFTDKAYTYGHPARLFSTDGQTAYIECGSCHNPHAWMSSVVNVNGTNTAVATSHFIRGQYRSTTEALAGALPSTYSSGNYTTDNANFCMSCHAYPSNGFTGQVH